ncbi:Carnosine N-methyltransferase [Linum grandiflorum]
MSQDVDCCDDLHAEQASDHCCPSKQRNCCSSPAPAGGGTICCSVPEEACCKEGSHMHKMSTEETTIGGSHYSPVVNGQDGAENETSTLQQESDVLECNGNDTSHECSDPSIQFNVPLVDVDKVRCIIRNIVRDWAAEGQKERDECYKPILEELDSQFPNRSKESAPSCLVPGAGLGRLALEISRLGFASQGNEFSYYMMICSSFILNHAETVGEWTIYPWIHSNCNSLSDKDQLRPVSIPDIHPASAGITEGFSMCGGDFVEVYSDPSQEGCWDAVVTCFFIDTAHNIVEYIETISKILKDGGVWINFGPLLYHFADMYGQEDEMSIELSLEDVKRVALQFGFEFEKEKTIETTYTVNPRSMMQNHYLAAFWTARKVSKIK